MAEVNKRDDVRSKVVRERMATLKREGEDTFFILGELVGRKFILVVVVGNI